jgi:hypothetical protein
MPQWGRSAGGTMNRFATRLGLALGALSLLALPERVDAG